jgi:hypothetical protein
MNIFCIYLDPSPNTLYWLPFIMMIAGNDDYTKETIEFDKIGVLLIYNHILIYRY